MRIYQLILVVLALVFFGIFIHKPTHKEQPVINKCLNPNSLTIPEQVDCIAPLYGQNPELLKSIMWCESMYNTEANHDGGKGKGATGLHKATFNGWSKEMNVELDYNSSYDQIKVMAWAFSQGEDKRDDWTTYRAYMNGGEYRFIQRSTGKLIISRCK